MESALRRTLIGLTLLLGILNPSVCEKLTMTEIQNSFHTLRNCKLLLLPVFKKFGSAKHYIYMYRYVYIVYYITV